MVNMVVDDDCDVKSGGDDSCDDDDILSCCFCLSINI